MENLCDMIKWKENLQLVNNAKNKWKNKNAPKPKDLNYTVYSVLNKQGALGVVRNPFYYFVTGSMRLIFLTVS